IDWPEDVPGPVEMERRRVAAGTRPGASVTFQQFDFTLGQPFEVTTTVLGEEEVELRGERRRLIKMRTTSDVLPETLSWIEPDGSEAKTSTSLMGMEITTVPASLAEVEEFVA